MTRITAGLLAAAAVGGWLTPLAAQKASRGPSLRAASYIYLTPNPYLGSLTARVPLARRPSVDRGVLHAVAEAAPARASWSTEHDTRAGSPVRVSSTHSHTARASPL